MNWCFPIVVLEKTFESPLDSKEIKPVNPKGNHPSIFNGRTDAEVEAPILWPPDAKSWLTGKDPDTGKDWGQEENGVTEDEMVGSYHRLNGRWVWANSRREWRTEKPGMLQFMGLPRMGHDLVTEQQCNQSQFSVNWCLQIQIFIFLGGRGGGWRNSGTEDLQINLRTKCFLK